MERQQKSPHFPPLPLFPKLMGSHPSSDCFHPFLSRLLNKKSRRMRTNVRTMLDIPPPLFFLPAKIFGDLFCPLGKANENCFERKRVLRFFFPSKCSDGEKCLSSQVRSSEMGSEISGGGEKETSFRFSAPICG